MMKNTKMSKDYTHSAEYKDDYMVEKNNTKIMKRQT